MKIQPVSLMDPNNMNRFGGVEGGGGVREYTSI